MTKISEIWLQYDHHVTATRKADEFAVYQINIDSEVEVI